LISSEELRVVQMGTITSNQTTPPNTRHEGCFFHASRLKRNPWRNVEQLIKSSKAFQGNRTFRTNVQWQEHSGQSGCHLKSYNSGGYFPCSCVQSLLQTISECYIRLRIVPILLPILLHTDHDTRDKNQRAVNCFHNVHTEWHARGFQSWLSLV